MYWEEVDRFSTATSALTMKKTTITPTLTTTTSSSAPTIKYIETPCEALPARLSQLQTSIIICLSKKSTRFVEARSK